MNTTNLFKIALKAIASNKLRSFLTALGIIIGVVTSSGMMEVARSGVFYPGQFSFQEIMMLFLGMICLLYTSDAADE